MMIFQLYLFIFINQNTRVPKKKNFMKHANFAATTATVVVVTVVAVVVVVVVAVAAFVGGKSLIYRADGSHLPNLFSGTISAGTHLFCDPPPFLTP